MTDVGTALPVGTQAPDFTLKDQNNEEFTLSAFRGEKAVLIIFYPLAFTGICSGELSRVRNDLADHGLTRLGVWSLEDNARAGAFYEGLGGKAGPRVLDRMAGIALPKVGYLFG